MDKLFHLLLAVGLAAGACWGAGAQELSLSTNLADYAAGGTLNIGAAYGVSRHWTVNAHARYNPFSYGEGSGEALLRQRTIAAGARWWPWHMYSGWWMGAGVQWQEFAEGGLKGPETSEGDRFGGSLSGGYSTMLGPHFNLDFGFGLWGGYSLYTTYTCQTCGRRLDSGGRAFILPNELILGISYIF